MAGGDGDGAELAGRVASGAAAAWTQPVEYIEELCAGQRALPGAEQDESSGESADVAGSAVGDSAGGRPGWAYADPGKIVASMAGAETAEASGDSAEGMPRIAPGGLFLRLRTDESRTAALRLLSVAVQADARLQSGSSAGRDRAWMPLAVALCKRALEYTDSGVQTAAAHLLAACMLGQAAGQPSEEGVSMSLQLGQMDRIADDVVRATLSGLDWLVQGCTSAAPVVALICGRLLGETASFSPSGPGSSAASSSAGASADRISDGDADAVRERLIEVV